MAIRSYILTEGKVKQTVTFPVNDRSVSTLEPLLRTCPTATPALFLIYKACKIQTISECPSAVLFLAHRSALIGSRWGDWCCAKCGHATWFKLWDWNDGDFNVQTISVFHSEVISATQRYEPFTEWIDNARTERGQCHNGGWKPVVTIRCSAVRAVANYTLQRSLDLCVSEKSTNKLITWI